MKFPEKYQDLLTDETKALVYLATVMGDGTPQVTPVWFSVDNDHILINTAEGRIKDSNMRARPHVALVIQDPDDDYRYMQIRGKVVERTYDGAEAHIHALSQKYRGKDWDIPAGQIRVLYKITPLSFDTH